MSKENKQTTEKEVIVSLNEDVKTHTHNEETFERMLRQQEQLRDALNKSKANK